MYTYQITTNNVQFNLYNSADDWFLKEGQGINSSTNGIYEDGLFHENVIHVDGHISATTMMKAGVMSKGAGSQILVGETGIINAYNGAYSMGDGSRIVNNGKIDTQDSGIVTVVNGDAVAINNGEVHTQNYGISFHATEKGTLINNGSITGDAGIAADSDNLTVTIGKMGSIDVTSSGIDITSDMGQKARIVVHGTIHSGSWALYGRQGDETFVNRGDVTGAIGLGDGNDVFDNRGGLIHSDISGGNGNDTFIIDDQKTEIREYKGDGVDTVKSTVSVNFVTGLLKDYDLENIVLLGKADSRATGNALDNDIAGNAGKNRISGGAGEDMLTGGKGNDIFIFKSGWGKDTVDDFGNGHDRIDLSGWKGVTDFNDLMHHHAVFKNGDAIFSNGEDSLVLLDTAKSELHASDFIF